MTDITDPAVIRYCDQQLRPLMERARDFKAALENATADYAANVSGLLQPYVGADPVIDNRGAKTGGSAAAEGIGIIKKVDINRARTMLEALATVLNDASVFDPDELMATFAVQPLRIRQTI